jgi:uncharacterized protein (DUF433 family)
MYRISVNPQIHFGKPCIAGTRITVQSILELLNEGLSFGAIIQDYYPDLQIEDIRACLQYAIPTVVNYALDNEGEQIRGCWVSCFNPTSQNSPYLQSLCQQFLA